MLVATLVGLTGCGREKPPMEEVSSYFPRLSGDLKQMQGHWESQSGTITCTAQVEGYTIRLTYEDSEGNTPFKRNACIKEIDQVSHRLHVHGDKELWTYLLERHDSHVQLELRFFDASRKQWVHSSFEQPTGSARVAGL